MLKTRIDFVFFCNADDDDAMAGVIHGGMDMACAVASVGCVPALLSWYPLEMHYVSTQPAVYFIFHYY